MWEYKQVLARRNTFEHELEPSEPSDDGSSATKDDDADLDTTQRDAFIEQRMYQYLQQITKEIPDLIQASVTNGKDLERFMKNVEVAIRSGNVSLARQWWETWWEVYSSRPTSFSWEDKNDEFNFVLPMLDSIRLADADTLLPLFLTEVRKQKNTIRYDWNEIKVLNAIVSWCIQNNLLDQGWMFFHSHECSLLDIHDAIDSLLPLCVASVQQGFVDSVEELGSRLDKLRFDDPKRLNYLLEQLYAKVSFESAKSSVDTQPQASFLTPKQMLELQKETLPREDVVLDTMGQDGWECFQVRYHTLRYENDSVVLYFKRPQTTSLDVAKLKPSVQAFFTK